MRTWAARARHVTQASIFITGQLLYHASYALTQQYTCSDATQLNMQRSLAGIVLSSTNSVRPCDQARGSSAGAAAARASSMNSTPGTMSALPSSRHSATLASICSRTSARISPVSPANSARKPCAAPNQAPHDMQRVGVMQVTLCAEMGTRPCVASSPCVPVLQGHPHRQSWHAASCARTHRAILVYGLCTASLLMPAPCSSSGTPIPAALTACRLSRSVLLQGACVCVRCESVLKRVTHENRPVRARIAGSMP